MPRLLAIAAITYGLLFAASCAADDDPGVQLAPPSYHHELEHHDLDHDDSTTHHHLDLDHHDELDHHHDHHDHHDRRTSAAPQRARSGGRGCLRPHRRALVPTIVDAIARYGGPVGDQAELDRWRRVCTGRGLPDAYNPSGASASCSRCASFGRAGSGRWLQRRR